MRISSVVNFAIQAVHCKRMTPYLMGETRYSASDIEILAECDINQSLHGMLMLDYDSDIKVVADENLNWVTTTVEITLKGETVYKVTVSSHPTPDEQVIITHQVVS